MSRALVTGGSGTQRAAGVFRRKASSAGEAPWLCSGAPGLMAKASRAKLATEGSGESNNATANAAPIGRAADKGAG